MSVNPRLSGVGEGTGKMYYFSEDRVILQGHLQYIDLVLKYKQEIISRLQAGRCKSWSKSGKGQTVSLFPKLVSVEDCQEEGLEVGRDQSLRTLNPALRSLGLILKAIGGLSQF